MLAQVFHREEEQDLHQHLKDKGNEIILVDGKRETEADNERLEGVGEE